MLVSFRQLIPQARNFEHYFGGFKLAEKFLMHLTLPLYYLVTKVNFTFCVYSEPCVLELGRIDFSFHVLVELMLLFPD